MESAYKMELTYTNVNGYLIPNLTYKSGEQMEQLGKYGFLRRDYLKNHRNSTYQVMLLQDTIGEHLLEVDKAAREREEVILKQLEEKEPFYPIFLILPTAIFHTIMRSQSTTSSPSFKHKSIP